MARRSTPAVSVAAEQYVAHCYGRGGSDGVRYSQRSLLSRFARHVSDRQVGNLEPGDFESFFYGPHGLTVTCARSTMGRYYQELKGWLAFCHRRRWCDDPAFLLGGITTTSTRVRRNRLRLSEAQMWAMVEYAPTPRDAAMLVFAMHTGCRISEILDVRIKDVSLPNSEVALRIVKTREEDVMRVSPVLGRYLREWVTVYTGLENPAKTARLFPAARRPQFVSGIPGDWQERGFRPDAKINNPVTIIRTMAERAGVDLEDGDGWHTIRRSVARIFFDRASGMGHDAALRMTSAFLHHKNTSTTEVYLGLDLETAKRDEVMSDGFLIGPPVDGKVTRLDNYREVGGNG